MSKEDILYEELLPYDVAHLVLSDYLRYYHQFKRITKRAKLRFEERNWHGIQDDSRERINLYRDAVGETKDKIKHFLAERILDNTFWQKVKRYYSEDIVNFNTRNIAETFYNSVFRHFHSGLGADEKLMFVRSTGTYREFRSTVPIFHTFYLLPSMEIIIQQIFHSFKFNAPFENLQRDIKFICKTIADFLDKNQLTNTDVRIEVLKSIFFSQQSGLPCWQIND
ncbi:MAG: isocitrate dehydrogenase kinase/phosphatase AceK regulatory subunit [Bacteroidota bacterium]